MPKCEGSNPFKWDDCEGTFTWKYDSRFKGHKYTGEWKDGKRHGKGRYTKPNGEYSEGEWKDDQMHFGTMTHIEGQVYTGEWKDGTRHGKGIMTFSIPESEMTARYEGKWKDGSPYGEGVFTYPNGNIKKGYWEGFGVVDGFADTKLSDGTLYKGGWKNDAPDGQGTMTLPNGIKYNCVYDRRNKK